MNDMIEPVSDERFLLHGRIADLVNIAGKRHSLASLNHLLNAIPGVVDGAFYMPDETGDDHITRLAACVVAPGMDAPRLLAALRERIDPVFLPRPCCLSMHCHAIAQENFRAQRCKPCFRRTAHGNPHEQHHTLDCSAGSSGLCRTFSRHPILPV